MELSQHSSLLTSQPHFTQSILSLPFSLFLFGFGKTLLSLFFYVSFASFLHPLTYVSKFSPFFAVCLCNTIHYPIRPSDFTSIQWHQIYASSSKHSSNLQPHLDSYPVSPPVCRFTSSTQDFPNGVPLVLPHTYTPTPHDLFLLTILNFQISWKNFRIVLILPLPWPVFQTSQALNTFQISTFFFNIVSKHITVVNKSYLLILF